MTVFEIQKKEDLTPDALYTIFKKDVVIIRNAQKAFGINRKLFNPLLLAEKYGDAEVDVVNQDPESTIMELNEKNRQFKRKIKLSKFVEYQMEFEKRARKAKLEGDIEVEKSESQSKSN